MSKVFWLVFAPSHLLIWLTVAATLSAFLGRVKLAQIFGALATTLFISIGFFPLYVYGLRPIEDMVPPPKWPAHVDGVVTLGGGLNAMVLNSRGVISFNHSESRVVGTFEIARRYPSARVVFAGGSPSGDDEMADTFGAEHVFRQMGLDPKRVVFEGKSRNTWENLVFAKRLVKPKSGEVWLLATSASHLPRAIGVANAIGWKMIPWPTDYLTPKEGIAGYPDVPANLMFADMVAHEWLGLLYYRLAGRSE